MSFRDNQDLRPREAGGFSWAEHELFSMFAPIIGPLGVSVYVALARQIPLAAINSDTPVTTRKIAELSCVSTSACAELMQQIFDLGMVIQTKYLDGRRPSYKLASLRELAKLGQKELLARAGVRNTDTAPFDQEAKHKRERERRKKKNEELRRKDEFASPHPLFEDGLSHDVPGVRTTDTGGVDQMQSSRVRQADTVSAESGAVYADHGLVSAESGLVSAGRTPLREERNGREEDSTPLPPAALGESGAGGQDELQVWEVPARPVLPVADCTIASPGFVDSLPAAVAWVMAQLGITKRRIEPMVKRQLELHCRQNRGETLERACGLMASKGLEMHANKHLLRHHPWGWARFIDEGIWRRPLPYDAAKASWRPEPGIHQAAEKEDTGFGRQLAYLEANAVRYEGDAVGAKYAARLRDVLAKFQDGGNIEEVDRELQAIEDQVESELLASMPAERLKQLESEADAKMAPYRHRMPAKQVEKVGAKYIGREIYKGSGLPLLSFFYMPRT